MSTIVKMSVRERACVLQGYLACMRDGDELSVAERIELDRFSFVTEQMLMGNAPQPIEIFDFLKFFRSFMVPRSGLELTGLEADETSPPSG